MTEPRPTSSTAEIIPFPIQRVAREDGQERLRRALQGLDQALTQQREAVAAWRSALGELGGVVSGLGDSLRGYRSGLDTLATRVDSLHAQSVRLECIADAALVVSQDPPA
jgi:hypothetical protein